MRRPSRALLPVALLVALSACASSSHSPPVTATPDRHEVSVVPTSHRVRFVQEPNRPGAYTTYLDPTPHTMDDALAVALVRFGMRGAPELRGLSATTSGSRTRLVVTLAHNDESLVSSWISDVVQGAIAEHVRTSQTEISQVFSSVTAKGPGPDGKPATHPQGYGAVRLGEVIDSPSDAALTARVHRVASRFGLTVTSLRILHPLKSAVRVRFTVPDSVNSSVANRWSLEDLEHALFGRSPIVEGALIELDAPDGHRLMLASNSWRSGSGGVSFAPGQDGRFRVLTGGPSPRLRG